MKFDIILYRLRRGRQQGRENTGNSCGKNECEPSSQRYFALGKDYANFSRRFFSRSERKLDAWYRD